MEAYTRMADAVAAGESAALATVVAVEGSAPREVGAKMIVYADGRTEGTVGGGKMEALVTQAAVEAIAAGHSRMVHYDLREVDAGDPGICGGSVDVYIDVAVPNPTLLLVGAGHVAMPVAEIAHMCGFRVVVVDDRADMASEERFPRAAERIAADIVESVRAYPVTPHTYVVLVTRGHALDEEALREVIERPAAYIGMIGSRRKVHTIFAHLREAGVDESVIGRVYSPIGMDIGSQTPAEIAVSIVGEMIAVRRGYAPPGNRLEL
jgi:xanthine dehydrogenase accessory factor